MTSAANTALMESWRLSLHNKSAATITHYTREMDRFAAWLAEHDRPSDSPGDLLTVRRSDVETWIGSMRDRGLAAATIRSRWIPARSFYGWLVEEEELERSPLARVKVEKPTPPPPPTLAADAIGALLKVVLGTGFMERRDNALLRVMLGTGMRVGEVCNLMVGDVDLRTRVILVRRGKGDKARLVRIDATAAAAVDRYVRARARHPRSASPWLWIAARTDHVSVGGLQKIVSRRATEAGIGHVHPHQLRHTFADRWLAAGGTEGDLQRLGGWESADVMRRYGSHRATDRALAAYDNINPMEGL